jgi:hypothetical protein
MKISLLAVAGALCLWGATLEPADVKVAGSLEYGQTSDPIDCTGTPKYSAFVFNGNGDDRIEVTVKGGDRQAAVSIADGSLKELATGMNHISFTLPKNGPDLDTYYIVFRDSEYKSGRFTVQLSKQERKTAQLRDFPPRGPGRLTGIALLPLNKCH